VFWHSSDRLATLLVTLLLESASSLSELPRTILSSTGFSNNFAAASTSTVGHESLVVVCDNGPPFPGVPHVQDVLQKNEFSAAEVEKIVGGNARRVLGDGWGA